MELILKELDRDSIRANFIPYTEKAFRAIPAREKPHILDVGCGTGVPTMKLAELCNCTIIALDTDTEALEVLDRKITATGLENRVKTMNCSIKKMDFPNSTFDIIWAEGSIFVEGFKRGLMKWKQFLKPGGFLAVHDEAKGKEKKLDLVEKCGYRLLDNFSLDIQIWRDLYFGPLEQRVLELRAKYKDEPSALKELRISENEIAIYKRDPSSCASIFLVMQKL